MASKNPLFLCIAGNTLPKRPSPLQAPNLKSVIRSYVVLAVFDPFG